ncbi:uncharacterized protein PV09_01594 [Verruconis gallopava]|uniref:Ubiquitin-conjugating enzyme E2C-binding protein n=1 Tax=Verruconis gallopava TaxID=253628 RepID=A0A0D1Z3U4_9PEZI|nr:uncharacterized protein PV09_01594 [Verruconis gallopava]KIW07652.1 hypothetical protein PV09_01594 [Verruconis gallopava]
MGRIELYAELLTNIRTVTLVASLHTESNQETRIELSGDGSMISIQHEGISASLRLPSRMAGGGTAALTLPPRPSKDLTLRLKVEETEPGLIAFEHSDENLVPWPATAMDDASGVQCRQCGVSLLRMQDVNEWRDLPNENWAEMMDFWHCHKPHEHETHDAEDTQKKGYSASSKLTARAGVGYVGLTYLILAEVDCENIQAADPTESSVLQCTRCGLALGIVDPATEGWKLYKWSLSISREDSSKQCFTNLKWISTQLLSAVENSGVRRFVVEPARSDKDGSNALLLWLFTDSLSFSSSYQFFKRRDPTRAMKIMWKRIQNASETMESRHFSHEHLVFPPHIYETLKNGLQESQFLLPQAARKFQDWHVGLLERFSWEDVSGTDATVLPAPKAPANETEEQEAEKNNRDAIKKIQGSEALLE